MYFFFGIFLSVSRIVFYINKAILYRFFWIELGVNYIPHVLKKDTGTINIAFSLNLKWLSENSRKGYGDEFVKIVSPS